MVEPARMPMYTYADLRTWPDDERWELVDGVPYPLHDGGAYAMSPGASRRHQEVSMALIAQFLDSLRESPCRVYHPPFDVRLPHAGEDGESATTVVQPDITVVCNRDQLDEYGCIGAPTLVVEIASPSTALRDTREKRLVYERAGVVEYWVIYPTEKLLYIYRLGSNGYYGIPAVYGNHEQVPVTALPGVTIDLARVFTAE
jgi:Uma2 family endonuclease